MPNDKLARVEAFLEEHKGNRETCVMCPRACRTDRRTGVGECGEPWLPASPARIFHFGEEPPITGVRGSGTIFFSGCNLHCVFCQNFPISQLHQANRSLAIEGLADAMLELRNRGAHNVNLVTPSHYIFQFVEALKLALERGFDLPIVYNSSGYDSLPIVRRLDGIVDVWLPDAKYASDDVARRFSDAPNYVAVDRKALTEMFRQTGGRLDTDDDGIATKGMIVRHLVLPGQVENSKAVLKWIAEELSPAVHISLMSQYFPPIASPPMILSPTSTAGLPPLNTTRSRTSPNRSASRTDGSNPPKNRHHYVECVSSPSGAEDVPERSRGESDRRHPV